MTEFVMRVCPTCAESVDSGASVCVHCDEPLPVGMESDRAAHVQVLRTQPCPSCAEEVEVSAETCIHCEEPLALVVVASLVAEGFDTPYIARRAVPPEKRHAAASTVSTSDQMEDIHEPVELYRSYYGDKHAENTSEFFEELVRRSGVDEQANIVTVTELRVLEKETGSAESESLKYRILRGVVVVALLASLLLAYAESQLLWLIAAPVAGLAWAKLNRIIHELNASLRNLEARRRKKKEEAWAQMAPLNQLYEWHIASTLVRRTTPRIDLDPYFTNARLQELRETFTLSDDFNPQRSVVCTHSGVLNGNPFVVAETEPVNEFETPREWGLLSDVV